MNSDNKVVSDLRKNRLGKKMFLFAAVSKDAGV